ncbi:MAG: YjfB family protein [Marinisporobacter sp.]|jgi:hypothetical protein|nr:YjfB family protein [Marinisporobacter sp.]
MKGADTMDINAMSTVISQGKIKQQAALSVMKIAMDTATQQTNDLKKMMEQSITPHVGGNIDVQL